MTKNFRLLTTALCTAILFTSCLHNNRQNGQTNSLATDSVHIALQYPATTDKEPACQVTIDLTYPVAGQDANKTALLNTLLTTLLFGEEYAEFPSLPATADTVANRTLAKLCWMRSPLTDEELLSRATYFIEIKAAPIYNDGEFLVYHRSWYSYEGGAHGMYSDTYDVIYLPSTAHLTLNDIFSPECTDKLNTLLIRQLLSDLHLNSAEELYDAGYFDVENIKATENFFIDNQGITWVYNPYEIGCFAIGKTQITLPYEEISYYIAEESPVRNLFNNRK